MGKGGRPALKLNVGDKFGYWEVIDNNPVVKGRHSFVMCKCTNCGEKVLKAQSDLKRKYSLGCKKCMGKRKMIPINIGDKFGDLEVISGPLSGIHKNRYVYKTKCICGNITYNSSYDLKTKGISRCHSCAVRKAVNKHKEEHDVGDLTLMQYNKICRRDTERRKKMREEFLEKTSMQYLWDLFVAQGKKCAITGDYIGNIKDASLDRIDSNKGYIPGNVQWTTKQANLSKHKMSMQELINFCQKVINHANQQPSQELKALEGSETSS
jgi:hypothetical protein